MASSFFVFEFSHTFLAHETKSGGTYAIPWRPDLVKVFGAGYVSK